MFPYVAATTARKVEHHEASICRALTVQQWMQREASVSSSIKAHNSMFQQFKTVGSCLRRRLFLHIQRNPCNPDTSNSEFWIIRTIFVCALRAWWSHRPYLKCYLRLLSELTFLHFMTNLFCAKQSKF
jgi:hypothetical protein